jgi:hypothetical protein
MHIVSFKRALFFLIILELFASWVFRQVAPETQQPSGILSHHSKHFIATKIGNPVKRIISVPGNNQMILMNNSKQEADLVQVHFIGF